MNGVSIDLGPVQKFTIDNATEWIEFSGIDLADDKTFVTNRFAPAHRVIRLLHNRAMRLSISSSSFGSTPSASIIALTPESDIISANVDSRFQFERSGWLAACAVLIRLGDEAANRAVFTENLFRPMHVDITQITCVFPAIL